jgi:hypothetical protein
VFRAHGRLRQPGVEPLRGHGARRYWLGERGYGPPRAWA